ncbi:sensor histidine kinase [Actinomadura violacea]|uniref:histidine kinase n=1 Tax=Actinomadura violacea TaxID=2819934 RepID=A0ABS3RGY2_9ACTN|nr:ATP-binding protein [Actinomadura violacea]MBO2455981.1 PAS domain-containing protein [Actinomadura violacea]
MIVARPYPLAAPLITWRGAHHTAWRLLQLPHLVALRGTTARDLVPLADHVRRILHADRLWIDVDLPSGPAVVDARPGGADERPAPPGGLLRSGCPVRSEGPVRIPREALPAGWRAGVLVPLRAPDGRHAGRLLLGWTRWPGRWGAARATGAVLSLALISTARSIGAFWANAWAVHEAEQKRSKLKGAIDHCDAAFVVLTPQDRVAVWNATMAKLTGVPAEHAVGRSPGELFTLTDKDGLPLSLADAPQGGVELTTPSGRRLWLEVFSSPSADRSAHPMTALFVDRSAKRQLEDMRQLMLASIHHELRDPLTMIRGHAELLETMVPAEEARPSLEAIVQAVEIMKHVIGDLDHLDTDPLAPSAAQAEAVEAGPLLRRTVAGVPSAASRTTVSPEPGLVLHADPIRVRECVLLILGNAEKYAPKGRIEITARRAGGCGVIAIADEGPGIPADERPLVLRPYYRLPTTRDLPGSGLGLHIADRMMKAMGGRLELSESPAGGLEVALRLPLAPPDGDEGPAEEEVRER